MKGMKKGKGKYMSDEPPAIIAKRFSGAAAMWPHDTPAQEAVKDKAIPAARKSGSSLRAGPDDPGHHSIVKKGGM